MIEPEKDANSKSLVLTTITHHATYTVDYTSGPYKLRYTVVHTFEHPGVKAPGTANKMPFLPANRSFTLTFDFGLPSCTSTEGSVSPIYAVNDD